MRYIKAEDVLPSEILTLVQNYVDGQMLYVPKKTQERSAWGTISGTKELLQYRNQQICEEYQAGHRIQELAEKHCLSEKSIQRILRNSNPSPHPNKTSTRRDSHESRK